MSVSYDYYRIFYYVGKYGSFTRAAKILRNNQPNITRAMNNLEASLGCRLFFRSNRGVTLTPEGERLFLHVQAAQEHLQSGEAEILSARNMETGTISVGATETALRSLLLPILREFHCCYPGIHIQITNQSAPQAVNAVRQGAVELAIITAPADITRPLQEEPLKEIQEILIASPKYKELQGKQIPLREIADYPFVSLNRETATYRFFEQLFASCNLVFHPVMEAATADQILPVVENEIGIGFVPSELAEDSLQKGLVFQVNLKEQIPPRSICLVYDKSRPLSVAATVLRDIIYRNT